MNYTAKKVITNGISLNVIQAGPESGPLVILLHGFPEFWYGWRNQIPALVGAGYRVWVPDQRGYNLSEKPAAVRDYRVGVLAADILGLISAAGCEDAFIVGHDWGAIVAWHLATYYPDKVKKLVNMNVPHPFVLVGELKRSFRQMRKSWYIFFFQVPWLPEIVLGANNANGMVRALLGVSSRGVFTRTETEKYKSAYLQPGAVRGMINWYRAIFRSNLSVLFSKTLKPRIEVPTLLIWGAQDIALGRELAQPSIDLCREGRLVFFEDASHFVQHDKPNEVNSLILEFLSEIHI